MLTGWLRTGVLTDASLLRRFTDDVFEPLQRVDQRCWAELYLGALLAVAGKKTLQQLARAVSPTPTVARGLQQFINSSPWDWTPVRRRLAHAAIDHAAEHGTPRAWTLAELTIPKRGEHSVGVHRRFDTKTGRVINCQRAIGLFLAADTRCVPVDWSLLLGDSWCGDEERRRRARIPEAVLARPAWAHILDLVTGVAAQPRLASIPWALDLRRIDNAGVVVEGLARHGLDFVCEVGAEQLVTLPDAASPAATIKDFMSRNWARRPHQVTYQTVTGKCEAFAVHSGPVRLLPRSGDPSASPRVHRALAAFTPNAPSGRQKVRFWITNLTDRRVEEILALARRGTASASALADLATEFGVQDFEGRSFPGWHHHITMASAAYAFRYLWAKSVGDPGFHHAAGVSRA
ncbi:IS701 family transposase [Streptomyces violascens]|uniref:IS701 family transposase n=1 Tax=Streptomyces violascens TaxID=67381 RepID=UPI0037BCF76D